jgi:hypothetical protein
MTQNRPSCEFLPIIGVKYKGITEDAKHLLQYVSDIPRSFPWNCGNHREACGMILHRDNLPHEDAKWIKLMQFAHVKGQPESVCETSLIGLFFNFHVGA